MKKVEAHIAVRVQPCEIVQVICETTEEARLDFQVEGSYTLLPIDGRMLVEVDFSTFWEFFPPETGRIPLCNYVAQKLESIPLAKKTWRAWLQAFGLGNVTSLAVADLPQQSHLKLQLLVAVLERPQVILIRSAGVLDGYDSLLWDIKHFLLRMDNPMLKPAFIICDTDVIPSMAYVVERLIVVEEGVAEVLSITN